MDRRQRRCLRLLVVFTIVMVPIAVWLGMLAASSQLDLSSRQQAEFTPTTATVVDVSTGQPATEFVSGPDTATVTWHQGDEIRHGTATITPGTEAGTELDVWVDADGRLTEPPTTHSAAVVGGVMVGVFTWLSLTVLVTITYQLGRMRWDQVRYRQWERDLRAFFGETTSY